MEQEAKNENKGESAKHAKPTTVPAMPLPAMPVFRSVQIAPRYESRSLDDVHVGFGSSTPMLAQQQPPMPGRMMSMPMMMKEAPKHSGIKSSPLILAPRSAVDASPQSKATAVDTTAQFRLPSLSSFYPLERTSETIEGVSLIDIVGRVSEFLRINSITTLSYPEDGRIECETSNLLEFAIQLWQARKTKSSASSCTILEVQRVGGSSMELQAVCKNLFLCVKTGETVSEAAPKRKVMILPADDQERSISTTKTPSSAEEGIEICVRMLECSHLDQNRLGIESLQTMTNSSIVGMQTALEVSRCVVHGEGPFGRLLQNSLISHFDFQDRDEKLKTSGFAGEAMHHHALVVMANALQVTSVSSLRIDLSCDFWRSIIQRLNINLESSFDRPQEGALSAKCFRLLATNPEQCCRPRTSIEFLQHVHRYGGEYHASLEKESERLIGTFSSLHRSQCSIP